MMIPIKRTNIRLKADPRKVVLRYLNFGRSDRVLSVINYVLGLEEEAAESQIKDLLTEFENRHYDLKDTWLSNYTKLATALSEEPSLIKRWLIGAYFTHEYSFAAAALFNPSIVPHPDQDNLEDGELRFIMSLRATGEGHISSIAFQTGIITADGGVNLDKSDAKLSCGQKKTAVPFDRSFVFQRLKNEEQISDLVRKKLPESFSEQQAMDIISQLETNHDLVLSSDREQLSEIFDLNYDIVFPKDIPLSSRVLFPQSKAETNGMEDARFVSFTQEEGDQLYLGTYTAYNGRAIRPQLIETKDFRHFQIRPFYGSTASNKGMALFPEKINNQYAMIGRQDGRCLSIMYSDDLYFWEQSQLLQQPVRSWEFLQMGNCGSPVKTSYGWLLLTHAVGAMRKYVLSFTLLDLHHPETVLASLDQPLLSPNAEEREGYVPNVLYTCGLIQHRDNLIIPYAMSDSAISFVIVETEAVIKELLNNKTEPSL